MRAKVVVFPIRGRNWCFSRSIDPSAPAAQSSTTPSTVKEFWNKISSKRSSEDSKVELAVDFVANKMNGAWSKLEKAPQGTIKNKIHGLGLKLLSRVKPSEIFFKSIPKEINSVDIVYPSRYYSLVYGIVYCGTAVQLTYEKRMFESTSCSSKSPAYSIQAVLHSIFCALAGYCSKA
ncbi:K+-H+ exchange-like protein [Perilla frutescens var. frutescens]|nr:K+-H+ exchange-like protein [Perilla frutescens var. frutescens]